MAAHILFDPNRDLPQSCTHVRIPPDNDLGKQNLDNKRCKCPNAGIKFRYSTAAESTSTAPSSNVSINCTPCPEGQRAIWHYNYLYHLRADPSALEERYASIW
ncbi:hypothetical protein B0H13DRAFT_1638613 [Mycena leptocephala]|nr:hypothetical protein B0H13DRAFT_1638613 [Mycena leptocephala]